MKWSDVIAYYKVKTTDALKSKDSKQKYIATSYQKIVDTLTTELADQLDDDVELDMIDTLGISDHMKGKLKYFKENPQEVLKVTSEEKTQKPNIKTQLLDILGIGDVKADELIAAGLKTIAQLKMKKFKDLLPESAQKMLLYSPDRQIAHNNIKIVEPLILSLCDSKDGCLSTTIVGSYRRRTATSRDIDVMVVSDDEKILSRWLTKARVTFKEENVIPYASGPDKLSVLIRFNQVLSDKKLGVYKLDVFRAPSEVAHAMMLYATGSKGFNIIMRKKAKDMKLLLNQDGLFERESNKRITTSSERDIFEALDMEYKEPWERN